MQNEQCISHYIFYYVCDANITMTLQWTRHRRACLNDNPFARVELCDIIIIYYYVNQSSSSSSPPSSLSTPRQTAVANLTCIVRTDFDPDQVAAIRRDCLSSVCGLVTTATTRSRHDNIIIVVVHINILLLYSTRTPRLCDPSRL